MAWFWIPFDSEDPKNTAELEDILNELGYRWAGDHPAISSFKTSSRFVIEGGWLSVEPALKIVTYNYKTNFKETMLTALPEFIEGRIKHPLMESIIAIAGGNNKICLNMFLPVAKQILTEVSEDVHST